MGPLVWCRQRCGRAATRILNLRKFKLSFKLKDSPKPNSCTKVSTANYRIMANVCEWAAEVGLFSGGKKELVLISDPSHLLACIDGRTILISTLRLINMLQWVRHRFQTSGFVWSRAEASLLTVSQAWLLFTNTTTKWKKTFSLREMKQKKPA